jgi:hypothetical protein
MIPDANHNDIFLRGMGEYLAAIKDLSNEVSSKIER